MTKWNESSTSESRRSILWINLISCREETLSPDALNSGKTKGAGGRGGLRWMRAWWRRGGRGKLSVARSISACLNWPVKSSGLKQMQIALTCTRSKKKKEEKKPEEKKKIPKAFQINSDLQWRGCPEQGEYTVCPLNGTMCESQTGLSSEGKGSGPSRLPGAAELILHCYKADHHHNTPPLPPPLLCCPRITLHLRPQIRNVKRKTWQNKEGWTKKTPTKRENLSRKN